MRYPYREIIKIKRTWTGDPLSVVPLSEVKLQVRVDFADDDTELTSIISRAIRWAENYCSIAIVDQEIEIIQDSCECGELPFPPINSIISVEVPQSFNGSGPAQYVTSTEDWRIDGNLFTPGAGNRQRVVYTAGGYYPDDIKAAILAQSAFLYENRGEGEEKISPQAIALANPYRVLSWI